MTGATSGRSAWERLGIFVASGAGIGYFPVAPATACSAVIVGLYGLLPLDAWVQAALIAGVIVVGVWTAGVAERRSGKDPSHVVIDEVAGQLIACFLVPKTFPHLAAAFVLFRIFDIGKWPPMRQLERLPGGWGIMADDLAAGLCSRLVLWLMVKG